MKITLDEGAFAHVPFTLLAKFLAQHDCRFEKLPSGELRIIHVKANRSTSFRPQADRQLAK